MASGAQTLSRLDAKQREQTPQALARLVVVGLFICLWFVLWLARIPMPVPFLFTLLGETLFFLVYWRTVFLLRSVRAVELAHYGMLAAEIVFHTTIVYFLGGISWLGSFAYVFGLIFTNTFLDLRRGLVYTSGASLAFSALIILDATGTIPHYTYLEQGPLRYADVRFVATTLMGAGGVFFSIYLWVNWVGHRLRQERDSAVRAQDDLLRARAALQRANEELEERVASRTAELEFANAALRESEERLRAVIRNSPVVLFALDRDGIYTFLEGQALDRLNVELSTVRGRSIFDVFREQPEVLERVRRTLAGEPTTAIAKAGGLVFEAQLVPLPGAAGEITGVIGVATDVTERKRAEEALRESEERYRSLAENTFDLICEAGVDGRFSYLSPNYRDVVGYEPEELLGTSIFDLMHPDDRPAVVSEFARAINARTSGQAQFRFRHKNGDWRWFESAGKAFQTGAGELRAVVVSRDVTDRKRAEEALRESEERYRWLIQSAPFGILIVDTDGRILIVNTETERLFGYHGKELLGRPVEMLLPQRFRDAHLSHRAGYHAKPYTRPMGAGTDDLIGRRKDGSEFPVDIRLSPLQTDEGLLVMAAVQDITQRKQAEDALREQARRDPLTGLLNHAAIVEELRRLIAEKPRRKTKAIHTVAMVDVDGLKAVNDTYGHQVGDVVLLAVAQALTHRGALVGRYGGDEFIAVLRQTGRAAAERYRAEVLAALAGAGITDAETGANVPVVASIGLACYPEEADTIEDLIRLSDNAMYAWRRHRPVIAGELRSGGALAGDRAAEMVGEIVPLLTSQGNLDDKLRLVAQRLSVGAGYDAVNFALFPPETGPPVAANTFARVPQDLVEAWNQDQRSEALGAHPIRTLFERTRRPVIIDDPWNDERLWEGQREILRAAGLRSVLVAPMMWGSDVVGSLGVASKQERAFTSRDAQFLTAVATQVAAIVRMATLVDELQASSQRLEEAQTETVMLLAAAAEAHDRTTGRHLQSVRSLVEALARELGYTEEQARELGLAGVLHDIGKIRVPDTVLTRSGRLSDEQWAIMRQHTTWGAQFLDGRRGFERAAQIARSHHERWDGTGYPDGLAGEAIPAGATIVAVADSFDAITSDRPYRKARPAGQAIRDIVACSGQQFSPGVVDALVRLHKRKLLPVARPKPSRRKAA